MKHDERSRLLGAVFVLAGLLLLVFNFSMLQSVFQGRYSWLFSVLNVTGGAILSMGVKLWVDLSRAIEARVDLGALGIDNIYLGRENCKKDLGYAQMIRHSDHVTMIGIKHSDFVNKLGTLSALIMDRHERFRLDIYFLDIRCSHRFLFEQRLYTPGKLDLADEIRANIAKLFVHIEDQPELAKKLNVYLYSCVPLGNVIALDDRVYILNQYQYFRSSVDAVWLRLNRTGYGAMVAKYIEHVRRENPIRLESRSSLVNLGNFEYINVLDQHGIPTGQVCTRSEIHTEGHWHRTVHVWIINAQREILIQKRTGKQELDPDKWDLSCAGHVAAGESSVETAIRETREELGVDVAKKLQFLTTLPKDIRVNGYIDREFVDIYVVELDVKIGELTVDPAEVSDVSYMHYLKLRDLVEEKDPSFVDHETEYSLLSQLLSRRYS